MTEDRKFWMKLSVSLGQESIAQLQRAREHQDTRPMLAASFLGAGDVCMALSAAIDRALAMGDDLK